MEEKRYDYFKLTMRLAPMSAIRGGAENHRDITLAVYRQSTRLLYRSRYRGLPVRCCTA